MTTTDDVPGPGTVTAAVLGKGVVLANERDHASGTDLTTGLAPGHAKDTGPRDLDPEIARGQGQGHEIATGTAGADLGTGTANGTARVHPSSEILNERSHGCSEREIDTEMVTDFKVSSSMCGSAYNKAVRLGLHMIS